MEKQKSYAFGKDIYLIGTLTDGSKIWLEQESWDCNWYWGFGYLETYTNNNNPERSKDIQSHQHVDGFLFKKVGGEYIHHFNQSPEFKETVLNDSESWELAELFKQFYTLKDTASIFHNGSAGITSSTVKPKSEKMYKTINEEMLPDIFKRIKKILTPKEYD